MDQQSSSDFSIIKDYIEIKNKYELEVKSFTDKFKEMEEKYKKHISTLEQEITKRNEHIKGIEVQSKEAVEKLKEKEEQLKTLGLQLHKLKQSVGGGTAPAEEPQKKSGFFK